MITSAKVSHVIDNELKAQGYSIHTGPFHAEQCHWHQHRGVELLMVHSGSAKVYSQTLRAQLTAGKAIIIPATPAHGIQGSFNRTVIHFCPELLSWPAEYADFLHEVEESPDGARVTLDHSQFRRLTWVASQLADLSRLEQNRQLVRALFNVIAADLRDSLCHEKEPATSPDDCLLQDIIAYMNDNIKSPGLSEILSVFDIGQTQLWSLFKNRTGYSPGQYWARLRLDSACHLLDKGISVEEVAMDTGFDSLRGFQRAFRRRYGMSATEYRRRSPK